MIFVSKAQWGANAPNCTAGTVHPNLRTEFFVHHSTGSNLGNEDSFQWVRNIQSSHIYSNGWCDIGYNFLVDDEGRVFEGRGWDAIGAHCPGHNTAGIGVCYLGDGAEALAPKALVSIRALADEADRRAGKSLKRLGHRDGIATACPGNNLYKWVHSGMPVEVQPIIEQGDNELTEKQADQLQRIDAFVGRLHVAVNDETSGLTKKVADLTLTVDKLVKALGSK